MHASVPLETKRITTMCGIRSRTSSPSCTSSSVGMPKLVPFRIVASSASSTIGAAWPRTSGPHDRTKSMYSLPSTSQIRAPSPRAATTGSPPTARNARTGELTPPGNSSRARAIISSERTLATVAADRHLPDWKLTMRAAPLRRGGRQSDTDQRCLKIVVVDDFLHCHFRDRSRDEHLVQIIHAVDIVGLLRQPCLRHTAFGVGPIDHRHRGPSDARFVAISRDAALHFAEPLEPLALHRLVDVVGVLRGARTFLRRIGERPDAFELYFLEEFEQLLELLFGLTRQAD